MSARTGTRTLVQAYNGQPTNSIPHPHSPVLSALAMNFLSHAKAVAMALGGRALALLCGVLCCDYKYFHSGLPDLLLMRVVAVPLTVPVSVSVSAPAPAPVSVSATVPVSATVVDYSAWLASPHVDVGAVADTGVAGVGTRTGAVGEKDKDKDKEEEEEEEEEEGRDDKHEQEQEEEQEHWRFVYNGPTLSLSPPLPFSTIAAAPTTITTTGTFENKSEMKSVRERKDEEGEGEGGGGGGGWTWSWEARFVEVKSVNDRLSGKQRLWLQLMCLGGLEAEVLQTKE